MSCRAARTAQLIGIIPQPGMRVLVCCHGPGTVIATGASGTSEAVVRLDVPAEGTVTDFYVTRFALWDLAPLADRPLAAFAREPGRA